MRPGWKMGKYSTARREVGVIQMGAHWGATRGDQYVGTCSALGLEVKGCESYEAAQEAIERLVEARLREALKALEEP